MESISGEFLGCGSVRGVNETISLTVRCNTKCDACEIVIHSPFPQIDDWIDTVHVHGTAAQQPSLLLLA